MSRVMCFGLGPIGQAVARACDRRDDIDVVAAIDPANIDGLELGIPVHQRIDDVSVEADTAIFSTTSDLQTLVDQVTPALKRGMDVVSTCEELAFPSPAAPKAAAELDAVARRYGRSVVGAGVNPGFAMDVVPALASTVCFDVERIEVKREVDLGHRRQQLSRKLGVGLEHTAWQELEQAGQLGHRGLVESARLCALAASWSVGAIEFSRTPITDDVTVTGIVETVTLGCGPGRNLDMTLRFAQNGIDRDVVAITGTSTLRFEIAGLAGDEATVARTVHAARVSDALAPGLRLPIEVPPWAGESIEGAID